MQRLLPVIIFFIVAGRLQAQDTIVLNSQPNWNGGLNIAGNTWFYEDFSDVPLEFDEIKNKPFVPYDSSKRKQRFSTRPLIIQWLRFTISNTSATDTLHLYASTGARVLTRLYDSLGLLAKSGIYQTDIIGMLKGNLPLSVKPQSVKTFWIRMQDRSDMIMEGSVYLNTAFTTYRNDSEGRYYDRILFLLLGLVTGGLFFITVFAAFQYYLYREVAFLWYISYTGFAALSGLFFIDIRHTGDFFSSFFHDLMFSVVIYLVPVLYSMFIDTMLKLHRHFKKTWWVIKILLVVIIIQMLVQFIVFRTGRFVFTDYYGYLVSPVTILLLNIILLVLTALSKEKVKWFLFAGMIGMIALWILPITGFLPWATAFKWGNEWNSVIIFVPFFMLLGIYVEAICFSFALSYRSKLVLYEKNAMQQVYAKQLQEELESKTRQLATELAIKEEQNLKQVSVEFEQRIAETEMTALRAQMNPHFIFNCLNSIKLYTLENDSTSASEYLTVFSKLIRLVLENSRSEKVTLKNELEALRLYIELEAMRFKDKVSYSIHTDTSIDQEYIEIPPLLLQPYVENAIWHGLMHKNEGGIIMIDIKQPSEHLLVVQITDNGIGREAAAAYKSKSAEKKKSYGLKMTSERLSVINQLHHTTAAVEVTDLKDENNNAAGTKVIITIPV